MHSAFSKQTALLRAWSPVYGTLPLVFEIRSFRFVQNKDKSKGLIHEIKKNNCSLQCIRFKNQMRPRQYFPFLPWSQHLRVRICFHQVMGLTTRCWAGGKLKLFFCLIKHHAKNTNGEVEVPLHAFLSSTLDGIIWSASRPGRFTFGQRTLGNHWMELGGPGAGLDAVV
jgi:hypothetical protein